MNRKELKIGLFGFGCVGKGLFELLQRTPQLNAKILKICVKDKNKKRLLPLQHYTYNADDVLNNKEINTIVELIDDSVAAFEIVKKAMENGKAVVSANKKMIAEHFNELLELQEKHQVPFLYEASCCASIPILRNLEEYYDNDFLSLIQGIVNGSTNYILTQIVEQNTSYQMALEQAQENGFAESDPMMDVCGFDAKYKLLILIAHAFGTVLKSDDILNVGIDQLTEMDFQFAKEKGLKIKLIAHAQKDEFDKITAFVMPTFIESKDKLYSIDNEFNAVKIVSGFSDTQFFIGKGAGSYPTSSAVISDISALTYNYKYEYKKLKLNECLQDDESIVLKIYLRCSLENSPFLIPNFIKVFESYSNTKLSYTIGLISLMKLKMILNQNRNQVSVVLFESLS
jgi:homoserine dehydrogenase